ncbi:polysaccharide deacetylase family protein [Calorimonas adulescens]|uniref:Polysaccharide deacetylase family protein n=1 Tax=Calorimonas adulescens TaxID=2606906 RepID=A0A5D8QGY7_9THEO|nr:polysaccharide deacetylase family protein [Calorimonas adulescens]TZE82803.1 polysaccharide deacetylase family protein [Calorimonas adulescens]
MKRLLMLLLIVLMLVSTGCGIVPPKQSEGVGVKPQIPAAKGEAGKDNPQTEQQKSVNYSEVKPNELGQVMILMYHEIGDKEAEWERTPDNFRKDLQTLYDKGYRLISLNDLLDGNINVEAGFTPVVLTFDDGDLGQFKVKVVNGKPEPDPNSAVGILMDFYKEHPDFGRAATFYIYYPLPFREREYIGYKLKFLVDNGFEIGNHTDTHANLSKLDVNGIQKELGLNLRHTQEYVPGYNVNSLALPYGSVFKEYSKYLLDGSYDGIKYHNKAVLMVGANPAESPYDVEFDPLKVPRVRGSEMNVDGLGIYDWIKYFDEHPEKRYVSDGDPDTIVVPKGTDNRINRGKFTNKRVVVY